MECFLSVDEHVASAASHEDFDAWYSLLVEYHDGVGVRVGGSEEEGVVDSAVMCCYLEFFFEVLDGGGLWDGVGHVHVGCDPACCCCSAFAGDVGFVCESGFAEVDMVVYDSGEEVESGGVNFEVVGL